MVVCTFLIAECKQYWQFFLAQGLGIGLAGGIMVGPALVVVSQWFSKKRGLALAFCVNGASWGSVVFPCAAESLIPLIGFVRPIVDLLISAHTISGLNGQYVYSDLFY